MSMRSVSLTGNDGPSPRARAIAKAKLSLTKQTSEGTIKLQQLRKRLEELEAKKAALLQADELERKQLHANLVARYNELRECVDKRIAKLEHARKTLGSHSEVEGDDLVESPMSGRNAALAIAAVKTMSVRDVDKCRRALKVEQAFLERQALAAKVMAHVSLQQKKLLNLAYSWLRTFLPHCLGKINRVSFGLLTEDECKGVLRDDPMVPRSRLKLAVPFVGKDVFSPSSEFAHPDIIIGLTILAYRYSGMRWSDFDDVVDALTAEFSREIGPARERPSSKRHETWVLEAGGKLRGLKNAKPARQQPGVEPTEVVQLKFLSKSNAEQMQKLFALWQLEPLVIQHYLNIFVFPAYMRHQRQKISASGQTVGGDMLFGRRVGFSGTPSDLLPKELGKCSYETGDDGKMLSTVLDRAVASFEHLEADWTVAALLKKIATSENPRYYALIDTGALITGYSNKQVAQELLAKGLPWCDGVVFLDENDKQNVLVRDTGRVVPADQCGVPLDRRFAFYDQIHTTGMDIQHVVNATAVITLGKDMVFRDFVQGAFRMRGIGQGQAIRIFIIPEVRQLIDRELANTKLEARFPDEEQLVKIVAWLVVNSMRSEQTQWSMLCLQNVTNVFRKNAFRDVLKQGLQESTVQAPAEKSAALTVFDEPIDFTLDATVPDPVPFLVKLREELDAHDEFVETAAERAVAEEVLDEVARYSVTDGRTMERLDSEQEREQEQEQEKEVQQKREQQIEVEKFVDREYTRSDEAARAWHVSALLEGPQALAGGAAVEGGHPFFPLADFKMRYGEPLKFPSFVAASRNYFNPNWSGLRRLKNVVVVLEYAPDAHALQPKSPEETLQDAVLDDPRSEAALAKALALLASSSAAVDLRLSRAELKAAVRAATDVELGDMQLDGLARQYGDEQGLVGREGFRALLTSGRVRVVEKGRYFVALSLAEAETLRRVMHLQREGESLLGSASGEERARWADCQAALRYVPLQTLGATARDGLVLDASRGWRRGTEADTAVSPFQSLAAHSCMRFLDCAQHFHERALNVLVRCLQRDAVHLRELFFQTTVGARRRLERKWQETPLAKVFTMANEWMILKHHAQAVFIRQALSKRQLTLWEAFTSWDHDDNGVLSPAEFYGALRSIELPDLTPDDVVDMIEGSDRNADGVIDYREFLDMLREGGALLEMDAAPEDDSGAEEGDGAAPRREMPAKVEPFGGDVLREIMASRRREASVRAQQDRARREAYQQAMDIKVFEAELAASKHRKGGPNPLVAANEHGGGVVTTFRFNSNDAPIRMVATGKYRFAAFRAQAAASARKVEMTCNEGHVLTVDSRWWEDCVLCARRTTKFRCSECNGHPVCVRCHQRFLEDARRQADNLADKVTYCQVFGGSSFSLAVPAAACGLEARDDGEPVEVRATRFSVTLEARMEKLPPKGHVAALLRFFPTSHGRSRIRNLASVYVTHGGAVVPAARMADDVVGAPAVMRAGAWHCVTVSVDADEGWLASYVDGQLCLRAEELDSDALTLRHQLVVFGGGKQAQARGGHVYRLLVHDRALDVAAVAALHAESLRAMRMDVVWLCPEHITPMDGAMKEFEAAGFGVTVVDSLAAALKAVDEQLKCVIVSLNDVPLVTGANTGDSAVDAAIEAMRQLVAKSAALVVVAETSSMTARLTFKQGERIHGRWKKGSTWYPGRISQVLDNDLYSIQYDDGDQESSVSPDCIRSNQASKLSASQVAVRDRTKALNCFVAHNEADLKMRVFAAEAIYLTRLNQAKAAPA